MEVQDSLWEAPTLKCECENLIASRHVEIAVDFRFGADQAATIR